MAHYTAKNAEFASESLIPITYVTGTDDYGKDVKEGKVTLKPGKYIITYSANGTNSHGPRVIATSPVLDTTELTSYAVESNIMGANQYFGHSGIFALDLVKESLLGFKFKVTGDVEGAISTISLKNANVVIERVCDYLLQTD